MKNLRKYSKRYEEEDEALLAQVRGDAIEEEGLKSLPHRKPAANFLAEREKQPPLHYLHTAS